MTILEPRTHAITLYQGDDLARLAELEAQAIAAEKAVKSSGPRLLGETDDAQAIRDEHAALLEEAKGRAVKVVLRALGRKTWRELVAKHPPREDNETDKALGVNEETFSDALVPLSIGSPVFESDSERDEFLDVLSFAQFDQLYAAAYYLNRAAGDTPKALLSSPSSSETSN